MMLAVYLISALLCLIMFAALMVNAEGTHRADRTIMAVAAVFCILCPVINTLVAVAGVVGGVSVIYLGYK